MHLIQYQYRKNFNGSYQDDLDISMFTFDKVTVSEIQDKMNIDMVWQGAWDG